MLHTEPWLTPHCADTAAPCPVSSCPGHLSPACHCWHRQGDASRPLSALVTPCRYPERAQQHTPALLSAASPAPGPLPPPRHIFLLSTKGWFSEHNYPSLWKHGNDIPMHGADLIMSVTHRN